MTRRRLDRGMQPESTNDRRGRPGWLAIVVIAVTFAALVLYFGIAIEPYDLQIVRLDVPCPQLRRGPVRLLLLSDVDFPRYRSNLEAAAAAAGVSRTSAWRWMKTADFIARLRTARRDAMQRAINKTDIAEFPRFQHRPDERLIDNRGRTTALGYQHFSLQHGHLLR